MGPAGNTTHSIDMYLRNEAIEFTSEIESGVLYSDTFGDSGDQYHNQLGTLMSPLKSKILMGSILQILDTRRPRFLLK